MNEDVFDKYMKAGRIAATARDTGADHIKTGVSFSEIVNEIESIIKDNEAGIAFPTNISINHIAAHFTPQTKDTHVFHKGDIVKVDVGAHVDGYIADTAVTIEVETNEFDSLRQASADALDEAIQLMKPGVNLSQIGKKVEETIKGHGFKPIENLTGHSLNRYNLHSGMSVPSIASTSFQRRPRKDDVIAVEPFATTGSGRVISGSGSHIYLLKNKMNFRRLRDRRSRLVIKKLQHHFHSLPFASRWCEGIIPNADRSLLMLEQKGMVHHFPQLVEQNKGMVSQKEHTMIVTEDGCQVTTYGKHEQ
ncbi:MAG: type II methionyl aminopeptidase [Candidatus Thermoplasmatota archaeon]|nr:type II methionyl aminopeptidase [Candidatus Thermoplasmatota archaeon]